LALYKLGHLVGKDFSNRLKKLIDNYYIISYDFEVGACYKENASEVLKMFDLAGKAKKSHLFSSLLENLSKIEENRNKSSVLLREKLTKGQWSILFFLAGIILFSIFYLRSGEIYSHIITVLLSTVLILIILVLRDLQNLRLAGGQMIMEESGQEVLEFMGLKRYYNHRYISEVEVPKRVKEYRLGLHKAGEKFNIKVIKNPNYYK